MNPTNRNTLLFLLISSLLPASTFGQKEGALDDLSTKAADLEAQVRKLDASTVEGANVLLELSDLYHKHGRAFGMIRTGKTFVKTHKGHPRHKELMLKLLDAYLVTSRNDDIVSTSRQFLEFYGKDAAAPRVARELAVLLNRLGKRDETAKAYEHAWNLAGVKGPEFRLRGRKAIWGQSRRAIRPRMRSVVRGNPRQVAQRFNRPRIGLVWL